MDLNNLQTGFAGFLPSSVISFMHFEDILMAFILGMIGSMGAFTFQYIKDKINGKKP